MNGLVEGTVTVALAIVGLAMLSVLVSRKSNTSAVIQSGGSALGNTIAVASAPVTGADFAINLGYPGGTFGSVFGS